MSFSISQLYYQKVIAKKIQLTNREAWMNTISSSNNAMATAEFFFVWNGYSEIIYLSGNEGVFSLTHTFARTIDGYVIRVKQWKFALEGTPFMKCDIEWVRWIFVWYGLYYWKWYVLRYIGIINLFVSLVISNRTFQK